jgi:hypothetical protein
VNRADPTGELAFVPALGIALVAATGIGVGVPIAISNALESQGYLPEGSGDDTEDAAGFVASANAAIFSGASLTAGAATMCQAAAAGFANPAANSQAAAFLSGLSGGPAPGIAGAAGRLTRQALQLID